MRNLKKVLSLALALVMLLGMMVVGAGAATTTSANNLTEANEEAIAVLKATKVMTNKRYGDPVTRAEAAKMALTIYNPDLAKGVKNTKDSAYFKDVKNHWAAGYIDLCFSLGIVSGRSKTVFDPNGSVTGYELAKMVMVAMGKTTKYTGSTWTSKVMADVTELKLGTDAKISNWNKPVTRLQAAQLTFNGLTKNVNGDMKYVVVPKAGGAALYDGDDYELAKLVYAMNANTAKIEATPSDKGSLGDVNFGLKKDKKDDGFGHEIAIWTMGDKEVWAASTFVSTANIVIANQKEDGAKTIENKTLKDVAGFAASWKYVVDGNDSVNKSGVTTKAHVAGLCHDNNVVEIYLDADKKIAKIVVVNTYAGKVTVTEAKGEAKRSIGISGDSTLNAYETEDFVANDIVLYTKSYDGTSKYNVKSIEAAQSFNGTITSYTNANVYKINGNDYTLAETTLDSLNDAGMKGLLGAETTYFLGVGNNKIIAKKDIEGAVSTDVVYVLATNVTTAGKFGDESITAELQVVLPTGEVAVYTMPIKKGAADAADSNKIPFTYKLGSNDIQFHKNVDPNNEGSNLTTALNTALANKVFTYTLKDSEITLAAKPADLASNTAEGVITVNGTAPGAAITKASVVSKLDTSSLNVILNSKTVYVLIKDAKTVKVVTGAAALEDTSIAAANATMVITKTGTNNIAQVVFAKSTAFTANSATTAADYVYVDGSSYSVSKNAQGGNVYTYTATKADGSKIDLIGADASVTSGVYKYNSNNEIVVDDSGDGTNYFFAEKTIGLVTDEIIQPDSTAETYKPLPSDDKVVIIANGAKLEAGAKAWTVTDAQGNIVAMFVTAAKPAVAPTTYTAALKASDSITVSHKDNAGNAAAAATTYAASNWEISLSSTSGLRAGDTVTVTIKLKSTFAGTDANDTFDFVVSATGNDTTGGAISQPSTVTGVTDAKTGVTVSLTVGSSNITDIAVAITAQEKD